LQVLKENDWYKERKYLHFDRPIGRKKAVAFVTNPSHVTSHAFYPFIRFKITTKKVQVGSDKKICYKKKERPIMVASHIDSHIYAYYAGKLHILYEKVVFNAGLHNCVLAFRSLGKSNINFAKDAFDSIKSTGNCTVFCTDIESFFDKLDHTYLKKRWMDLYVSNSLPEDVYRIFKSLTRYAYTDRESLYQRFNISKNNPRHDRYRICSPSEFRSVVRTEKFILKNNEKHGIPQGSPISALLSNIYMLKFDQELNNMIKIIGGRYFRYCDDLLIIIPSEKNLDIERIVTNEVNHIGLSLNNQKTFTAKFKLIDGTLKSDRPIQYLGFNFDGKNITLRSSSLSKYSAKMKSAVRKAAASRNKINKIRTRKGLEEKSIYRRSIFKKYSHLGTRNFITYALRSSDIMGSKSIRRQVRSHMTRIEYEIEKYDED